MENKPTLTQCERLMLRALIMVRQAGNASGSLSFLLRTKPDNTVKKQALLDHLKCDLGDLILQAEMLTKDLELNLDEVKQLAYDRYNECKQEFKSSSQFFI